MACEGLLPVACCAGMRGLHWHVSGGSSAGLLFSNNAAPAINCGRLLTQPDNNILLLLLSLVFAGVFWGRRNEALHVGEHDLQVYLKSLHNQLEAVALHPDPAKMVSATRLVCGRGA